MKQIKQRLETLERLARTCADVVGILRQYDDGKWHLNIGGTERVYATQEEACADFGRSTGPDSVLIIWDL